MKTEKEIVLKINKLKSEREQVKGTPDESPISLEIYTLLWVLDESAHKAGA